MVRSEDHISTLTQYWRLTSSMLDDLRKVLSEVFTQIQLPFAHIPDRRIVLDELLEVVDLH
jgi:hypothetical protein